jgi:opacity protein-like surface antigen
MNLSLRSISLAALLCGCLVIGSPAAAQTPESGLRLGGIVSASFGEGQPAPGLGVSAGYRITPRLGVEVEAAYVPDLDLGTVPLCPPGAYCALGTFRAGSYAVHARALSLTVNLRANLPFRTQAIQPYVSGGAGVGHIRRDLRDTGLPFHLAVKSTGPLVTGGGGVDVALSNRVVLGIDLRYQRILEEDQLQRSDIGHNLNIARLGSSVNYRF